MKTVAINGYKSYIGKNFHKYYKKKYKIIFYKKNQFKKISYKNLLFFSKKIEYCDILFEKE